MEKHLKIKIYMGHFIIFLAMTYAGAAVYDYVGGSPGLGVWSGDLGGSWPGYYEPGHYEWQPIEYHSTNPKLMRMLGHDAMLWVVSPLRQPGGYADPNVNSPDYFIPEGEHYYTGARWFAPEGEVITKIEFGYEGYIGYGDMPQFSIFAGTVDVPDTLYYMSSLSYASYDVTPFAYEFSPNNNLKCIEIRCWDAYPGDNIPDEIFCAIENIKVTTDAEPAPFILTCEQIWEAGQGMPGDLNKDCIIDFLDFAEFAEQYMMSNNP
ncbi:MAG: hypothetical protein A2Y10_01215 [Planctomycetes bacterium GWF2_41_51]|nr:MAG: hypothetical protein A2Y10_01215 [Planctomycetes bacterium GWF2_41_51]HBG25622.1 hypothetical protein [Phycisphaerales bacterium]